MRYFTINFKILDLTNRKEWKKYFSRLPLSQQDVYFTPEYYELFENNKDGKAQCFIYEKDDNIILYPFLMCVTQDHYTSYTLASY